MNRVMLTPLLFSALLLIPLAGTSAESQQRLVSPCESPMIVQTIELSSPVRSIVDPSTTLSLVEWQAAADPGYCVDCSCYDQDCNENCSKCW